MGRIGRRAVVTFLGRRKQEGRARQQSGLRRALARSDDPAKGRVIRADVETRVRLDHIAEPLQGGGRDGVDGKRPMLRPPAISLFPPKKFGRQVMAQYDRSVCCVMDGKLPYQNPRSGAGAECSASCASGDFRCKRLNLEGLGPEAGLRQVVVHLHAQPMAGHANVRQLKAERHLRANRGLAAQHAMQLRARHAKRLGGFSDRHWRVQGLDLVLKGKPRMGRVLRHDKSSLVAVDQFEVGRGLVGEGENDPPVRPHRNGPIAFQVTLQGLRLAGLPARREFWPPQEGLATHAHGRPCRADNPSPRRPHTGV